ncbi:metallophosphoesterase family protein [Planctomyces sp. SH-PL62]|uniref:metallophosphoesterase family protein n=1 Tax=Planctomyces sp. SH-PL62 TaxID=1636152 RepID=UPI00078D26BB|nr:metallophosphoesterase [Planctomyces sp. SH-PL62]AMV37442.1 Calcineurin-like phosphoesterase [Planctomyces sp. SH-PL62]
MRTPVRPTPAARPALASTLALILILGAGPASAQRPEVAAAESEARAEVLALRGEGFLAVPPWVQLLGGDEIGVGWMTAAPGDGVVEWTQEPEGGEEGAWKRSGSSRHGLKQANSTIQKAVLKGYDPSKPLRFRAVSRPITKLAPYSVVYGEPATSKEVSLPPTRRDDGSASFLVFNDVHDRIQFYPLLTPLAGGGVDFMVFNGDVLTDPMTERQVVESLLLPMAWFASKGIPCFFLRGNHETRGAFARLLPEYLILPEDRYYAAMTFGAVRVLLLDTGEDKPDASVEYSGLVDFDAYMEEERDWLSREIAGDAYKAATWRVVVQHIPPDWRTLPRDKSKWYGPIRVEKLFGPLYDSGKVDLIVAGHNHHAEVIPPCPDASRGFQYPVFVGDAHPLAKATVLRVDASPANLRIRRFQSDGAVGAEQSWDRP